MVLDVEVMSKDRSIPLYNYLNRLVRATHTDGAWLNTQIGFKVHDDGEAWLRYGMATSTDYARFQQDFETGVLRTFQEA